MASIRRELLVFSIIALISCARGNEQSDCVNSESPIACRSVNFISRALNQVITNHDDTLKIMPGLEIVQNDNINNVNNVNDERSMPEQSNETFITRIAKYLQTHDLKVKFSDMVGKTDLQEVVNSVLNSDDPAVEEARKKDKGGGYLMMSGLMMGKMMAALGLGGVGALALKALGVSMMALLLAGIVALKKLTEGGGDGGHQVHYVSAGGGDHHRKRRNVHFDNERSSGYGSVQPLPYRGYGMNS